ncbi:MAG: efflux transporter outer membrane subunit [Planctomycetaceae bacterium]|nr:efflux transporter outer membrane subunit [Planctomycetaceae bacterium]
MCRHGAAPSAKGKKLFILGISILPAILLMQNGCTVGPDFARPEAALNESWSYEGDPRLAGGPQVNQLWWKTFNDPALDQLIQLACEQNLPLQIAALRIMEARAALGLAIGQQYPQQQEIFASAAKVGSSKNTATGMGLERDFWDYQVGFDAAWELDFWGRFRRGVEAAQANLIASAADYDNALVTLIAETARTYVEIRATEVLLELTNENARLQEDGFKIAQSRFNHGATTELDVTQARTLLESTRAAIPQLEIRLQQTHNALSTLLGRPTGDIAATLEAGHGIPTAPQDVLVGVPAELLRRRPDIRSAELLAAAQSARIGIAKADLYPSFSLFGEIGLQTADDAGVGSGNADFKNLFDRDSVFYSAGPSFVWPIFNYKRIENNVRIQDAVFQQLITNYQDTVLRAGQEVEDALTGFLKSQETRIFQENSVAAAQRSMEIAMTQYREGAVDYQRVIDTQRALLQEQTNLTQTLLTIDTDLIALYKALGGGWELRQGQPLLPESTQAQMQERTNWGGLLPRPGPDMQTTVPPARDIPLLQKPE